MRRPGSFPITVLLPSLLAGCMSLPMRFSDLSTQPDSRLLVEILSRSEFRPIMLNPHLHRVQVIYTSVRRDGKQITLEHHPFRLHPRDYFYPASVVKLPASAMALEKLNALGIPELTRDTPFRILPGGCQPGSTSTLTLAGEIKKALLVSDNDAFDSLYTFVGQEGLSNGLREKGHAMAQITHRLGTKCSPDQNRISNPVEFLSQSGVPIFSQAQLYSSEEFRLPNLEAVDLVPGYEGTRRSFLTLQDIHSTMIAIMIPEVMREGDGYRLKPDDRKFLWKYMSMYPDESVSPSYKGSDLIGGHSKYFLLGGSNNKTPGNIRIFNKTGMALGFLTDSAYIVDFATGAEFFISATVYVNYKRSSNDEDHMYDSLGLPFFKNLGLACLKIEEDRARPKPVQLDHLRFVYGDSK